MTKTKQPNYAEIQRAIADARLQRSREMASMARRLWKYLAGVSTTRPQGRTA